MCVRLYVGWGSGQVGFGVVGQRLEVAGGGRSKGKGEAE